MVGFYGRIALVHREMTAGIYFCQLVVCRPVCEIFVAFMARCLGVFEPYGAERSRIDGLMNCQHGGYVEDRKVYGKTMQTRQRGQQPESLRPKGASDGIFQQAGQQQQKQP